MITHTLSASSCSPSLRLFSGDGPEAEAGSPASPRPAHRTLSAEMSLSEFYQLYFRPIYLVQLKQVDKKTLALYDESIRWWTRLTDDPPLSWIDEIICGGFVARLAEQPGRRDKKRLSPHTIKKHCRNLQAVLYRTGPRSPKMRQGQGLLADPPIIEMPRVPRNPPSGDFSLAELGRWLEATTHAERPVLRSVSPADWWEALLLAAYYTGLRIGALLRIEYSMLSIDGDHVFLDVPAGISKRGAGQRQFVHPAAAAAIERIRTGSRPRIFAWPNSETHGTRWLHEHRVRLLAAAGIAEERRFGFHGLRKLHATELAAINPMAAQISLGHSTGTTLGRHYVSHRLLAEAILQMPAPPVARDDGQMRMF